MITYDEVDKNKILKKKKKSLQKRKLIDTPCEINAY